MSIQLKGFYFSANADKSANDHTLYLEETMEDNVFKLSIRYKNAEPNHLYELLLDADDIKALSKLLSGFAGALPTLPEKEEE